MPLLGYYGDHVESMKERMGPHVSFKGGRLEIGDVVEENAVKHIESGLTHSIHRQCHSWQSHRDKWCRFAPN